MFETVYQFAFQNEEVKNNYETTKDEIYVRVCDENVSKRN